LKSKKLLVVDDDPDILRVLKANLELYGFDPLLAGSWSEAQELLNTCLPELIILDLGLPDGDGMEICRQLKDVYPKVPIIMLTARDRVSDKVMGLESGADDYIVKPFETLELMARIKACLRRSGPLEKKIVIGELTVDLRAGSVFVKNSPVTLTPREYELLCLLLKHRGEVVSRDFIRKAIWKSSRLYSWSRVIDVHIQHLRQKIEKDPSNPRYLLTVPGMGYKFPQ
jgi:two-component system, OmpR family, alkaline phosphatase synthesis response regulator PhoP